MGFLTDLSLGRYYPTGSPIHALDPRVKMVGVLAVLITVLLTESPVAYVFLSITLGALVATSRLTKVRSAAPAVRDYLERRHKVADYGQYLRLAGKIRLL